MDPIRGQVADLLERVAALEDAVKKLQEPKAPKASTQVSPSTGAPKKAVAAKKGTKK